MSEAGDNNSDDSRSNSTDESNHSGGIYSISWSENFDFRDVYIVGVTNSGEVETFHAENPDRDPVDDSDSDSDTSESVDMQCDGYPMNEFVMKKMEDRPPCYDDIGDDRIASPEIPDSYDKAPITNSYDEPPPVYDAIHYARPGLRSALTTYISRLNEMVRSNYSTVTEVTTVTTTSEVVTRRANQENITQAQMIYSYCEFQPRNHPTFTTVYQSPRMTTAMTGPDPTDEEISQRFNWQEPISSDDEIQ